MSDGPTLTRRAVLAGSGGSLVAGVAGTVRGGTTVEVAATEPYRRRIRRAEPEGIGLRVRAADDAGRRLAEGAVDAVVAGRPDVGEETTVRAVTAGWAALAGGEWREVLRRSAVRDRWRGEAPVTAWSESTWERVAGLERTASADSPALVRGPRSDQYAVGAGGVGYYVVDPPEITTDVDAAAARRRGHAPVERVGYVHARDPVGGGVWRVLGAAFGGAPPFVDPAVDAGR